MGERGKNRAFIKDDLVYSPFVIAPVKSNMIIDVSFLLITLQRQYHVQHLSVQINVDSNL